MEVLSPFGCIFLNQTVWRIFNLSLNLAKASLTSLFTNPFGDGDFVCEVPLSLKIHKEFVKHH